MPWCATSGRLSLAVIKRGMLRTILPIKGVPHVYISGAKRTAIIRTNSSRTSALAGCEASYSLISVLNQENASCTAARRCALAEMTGPMKAPVARMPVEGWAKDEMSALALLEQGRSALFPAITLTPWGRWAVLPQPVCRCWSWKVYHRRQSRVPVISTKDRQK